MPDLDLGKQVGPLPLGAWMAVVGTGLGIAVYTRRQSPGSSEPVVVDDTSGTPGVGAGGSNLWTDITTPTTGQTTGPTVYTDNDAWGRAAIDRLVADGYSSTLVYSAITKALAGGSGDNKLSVQEYAVWARALVLMKSPPYPVAVPGPAVPPIVAPGTPATPAQPRYRMQWTSVRSNVPQTLAAKQKGQATIAANLGVWRPSGASLNSVIAQAAIRSACAPNSVVKAGRWVVLYMPVKIA